MRLASLAFKLFVPLRRVAGLLLLRTFVAIRDDDDPQPSPAAVRSLRPFLPRWAVPKIEHRLMYSGNLRGSEICI